MSTTRQDNETAGGLAEAGASLAPRVGSGTADARVASDPTRVPAWFDCELFCINDYAGVGGRRCGWRGRMAETRWDPQRRVRPCPRCAEASLMELDFSRGLRDE